MINNFIHLFISVLYLKMSYYLDRYYNFFSKKNRKGNIGLKKDKDYLMRFNSFLPYSFSKNQKSLSIVYSNSLGTMNLITKKGSSKLRKNYFTILNPNTDWEFICDENKRIDVLSFIISEELLSKYSFFTKSSEIELLDNPFDISTYDSQLIESVYKANYQASGNFLKALYEKTNSSLRDFIDPHQVVYNFMDILHKEQLNYKYKLKDIKGKKEATKQEVFKRIMKGYEYIHDNFEIERIDIKDLSLVCGLSEYHLYQSFKKVFGKTPHQYINYLRIQRAKEYIVLNDMSLSEISTKMLFPDLPTFSKLFKKTYGISPSQVLV